MKVKSSIVSDIDYLWNDIIVKFKTWAIYKYKATKDVYDAFKKAKSKWNFVKTILEKSFTYKRSK